MLKLLLQDCLESNEFVFAFGCAPHAIHNLCMDLIKHFPGVTLVLKQILYMVKKLKMSHLLLQLFDKLCLEKYKKLYTLRGCPYSFLQIQVSKFRTPENSDPLGLKNILKTVSIQHSENTSFQLPSSLDKIHMGVVFWQPLSKCIP